MKNEQKEQTSLISRRQLLTSSTGLALASAIPSAGANLDATKIQGPGPSALGGRSPTEALARTPVFGIASFTPLERLHGTITPSDLHFERHHAGIPALDADSHELLLHGWVKHPLKFTVADLMRFPAVTRACFVECSGNYFPRAGEQTPPHMVCGLTSQSEWTGVPLSTLLREAGVKPGASWILAEGGDAAIMSRSIPLAKALDDALVVYAQNGEAIRPAQGYPIRLLLPGWEGNTNVKWLRRLEVTDAPSMNRQETSKYTEPLLDNSIRQFSYELEARSIITTPAWPETLEPGWREIRGIAWSGRGRIVRVEVSTDGGTSWQTANLQGPILPKAHTRFGLPWKWSGQSTEILSRAVDETGYVQPTLKRILSERGPGSAPYHFNPITGWRILADGGVLFSPTG